MSSLCLHLMNTLVAFKNVIVVIDFYVVTPNQILVNTRSTVCFVEVVMTKSSQKVLQIFEETFRLPQNILQNWH